MGFKSILGIVAIAYFAVSVGMSYGVLPLIPQALDGKSALEELSANSDKVYGFSNHRGSTIDLSELEAEGSSSNGHALVRTLETLSEDPTLSITVQDDRLLKSGTDTLISPIRSVTDYLLNDDSHSPYPVSYYTVQITMSSFLDGSYDAEDRLRIVELLNQLKLDLSEIGIESTNENQAKIITDDEIVGISRVEGYPLYPMDVESEDLYDYIQIAVFTDLGVAERAAPRSKLRD